MLTFWNSWVKASESWTGPFHMGNEFQTPAQSAFIVCVVSLFSCVWLCKPMVCSPPGSSVHGILQARILEWVAMPFSRGPSRPRDQTLVSCLSCTDRRVLYQLSRRGSPLCIQSVFVVYLFYTWQCVSLNPKLLIFSPTSQAQCFWSSGEGLGFRPRCSDRGLTS